MQLDRRTGPALGALTVLCWASYNVAAKHGIDAGIAPQTLAFLRFAVPGTIALPLLFIVVARHGWSGPKWSHLLVLSVLGGPLFGWVSVSGYSYAPLSHGLLFAPVAVFLTTTLLGRLWLDERASRGRIAGAGVMLVGLAVLVGFDARALDESWILGALFFLAAGMMWGCYTVLLRFWRIPVVDGTLSIAAGSAVLAFILLGPNAVAEARVVAPDDLWLQIVMQGGIGGIVSVLAVIGAARTLPVHIMAVLPVFTPAVALAMALFVFGTVPTGAEIAGIALISLGFAIGRISWRSKRWPRWRTNAHDQNVSRGTGAVS